MARKNSTPLLLWSMNYTNQGGRPEFTPPNFKRLIFSVLSIFLLITGAKAQTLEGTFELRQDCIATSEANSNPNIIRPYKVGDDSFNEFEYKWFKKTDWGNLVNEVENNPQTLDPWEFNTSSLNPDNTNFNITGLQDNLKHVCVVFNPDHTVYQYMYFMAFGNEEVYYNQDFEWSNETVFFKQHPLSNVATADKYNGTLFSKRMWDENNANFDYCSINLTNTKFNVLTERNSFNRLALRRNKSLEILSSSMVTSSCFMWGGFYQIPQSNYSLGNDGRITISNNNSNPNINRPIISNANVAICIVRNVVEVARTNKPSLTFPFYEDGLSTLNRAAGGEIRITNAELKNNYFHFYSMCPIKAGEVSNSHFTCNPDNMLPPYEPKETYSGSGIWKKTITEAAFVGHAGTNNEFFGTNAANIFGNSFENSLYGIILPTIPLTSANSFYNHPLIAVRNYGTIFNPSGSDNLSISNQSIIWDFSDYDLSMLSNQIQNLGTYWNDINGFVEVSGEFVYSANTAKFGLSTGYSKFRGSNVVYPTGIYLDNEDDETNPTLTNQNITFTNTGDYNPNTRLQYYVEGNIIHKKDNAYGYTLDCPVNGILGGWIRNLNSNVLISLYTGASCNIRAQEIKRNSFINNKVGLELHPASSANSYIALNCNYFETDNTQTRTGIDIKSGTQAFQFGYYNNTTPPTYNLGGNVFPVVSTVDRSITPEDDDDNEIDVNSAWSSPSNWTSIKNSSSNTVNYHRFKNEFVGRVSSSSLVEINPITTQLKAFTSANSNVPTGNPNYIQVCYGSLSATTIFFPTPLIHNSDKPVGGKSPEVQISLEGGIYSAKATADYIQTLYMTDITGRVLFKQLNVEKASIDLPTTGLAIGTYLVHTVTNSGKRSTARLITQ